MSVWLDRYFLLNSFLPGISVIGYLGFPEGTIRYFGGQPTPTAAAWCRIMGAGDALIAYMSYYASQSKSKEVKLFTLK
jgi:hypothetical protein